MKKITFEGTEDQIKNLTESAIFKLIENNGENMPKIVNHDYMIKFFENPMPLGDRFYTCIQSVDGELCLFWKKNKADIQERASKTPVVIESITTVKNLMVIVLSEIRDNPLHKDGTVFTLHLKTIDGLPHAMGGKKLLRFY